MTGPFSYPTPDGCLVSSGSTQSESRGQNSVFSSTLHPLHVQHWAWLKRDAQLSSETVTEATTMSSGLELGTFLGSGTGGQSRKVPDLVAKARRHLKLPTDDSGPSHSGPTRGAARSGHAALPDWQRASAARAPGPSKPQGPQTFFFHKVL